MFSGSSLCYHPFAISPPLQPPPPGGEPSLGPKSIGNTKRQRDFLQDAKGAEADLHCDTMVQFCGAIPPPLFGGNRPDKRGEIESGAILLLIPSVMRASRSLFQLNKALLLQLSVCVQCVWLFFLQVGMMVGMHSVLIWPLDFFCPVR